MIQDVNVSGDIGTLLVPLLCSSALGHEVTTYNVTHAYRKDALRTCIYNWLCSDSLRFFMNNMAYFIVLFMHLHLRYISLAALQYSYDTQYSYDVSQYHVSH